MLAILEDAVASFQEYCAAKDGKRKQLFNDVRNGSSRQAVVGFSTLKLSVALRALTPITFVGGCCTGRKTNYQNLARSPWKRKENARAQLFRGVGRVMTDLFENDFARPLTEVNGNEYQVL